MNVAASSAKAVKPLFSLGAFPSSSAGAKSKVSPVAACLWPHSKQGLEEVVYLGNPISQTFWNSGGQIFQGARSDSSPCSEGSPPGLGFSRWHHVGEQHQVASFGGGMVRFTFLQRLNAVTLTLPSQVPWGGNLVCWTRKSYRLNGKSTSEGIARMPCPRSVSAQAGSECLSACRCAQVRVWTCDCLYMFVILGSQPLCV